jgi:hypothetical protein
MVLSVFCSVLCGTSKDSVDTNECTISYHGAAEHDKDSVSVKTRRLLARTILCLSDRTCTGTRRLSVACIKF